MDRSRKGSAWRENDIGNRVIAPWCFSPATYFNA